MKTILKWNQLLFVSDEASFASQQPLTVVWDEENNQQNWYAGLFLDQNDGDWFGLIIYKVFQRVMIVTRNNHD